MKHRHVIDLEDLTFTQLQQTIELAGKIKADPVKYSHVCDGKIMATLFYEPSTRTQMSFQTAMMRLGGKIIGFDNPQNSSVSKGENLKDTITIVSGYADIIAMRNPVEGSAKAASLYSRVPVINAGDGGHNHPTQTLTDLMTIRREKGKLDNLTIGMCGDLKFGRTVHSLIKAMSRYENINFIMISPEELRLPDYIIKDVFEKKNIKYKEVRTMEEVMPELDILYMTRVQKERFFNEADYIRLKDSFILDERKLLDAKEDLCIMHPLPRVNEISTKVDDDPRACYFKQALYGKYVRMALIMTLLGVSADENR